MKKILFSAAVALLAGSFDAGASVVVQYGPSSGYVDGNVNFQSGSGSGSSSYTFSRSYNTSSAWLASGGNYTGPALYGGYYQTLSASVVFTPLTTLAQIRNNESTSGNNDVIRFQSMYATSANITSATQNFAVAFSTGGNFTLDATSVLNWNARSTANPSGSASMRFLLVAGGTTYLSNNSFTFTNTSTTYSINDPDTINWAAWTPGSTMDFSGLTYNTLGSSLSNITFAGFAINQSTTAAGQGLATLDTTSFSADLVPEPTTWALLACSLTALMIFRRRRKSDWTSGG